MSTAKPMGEQARSVRYHAQGRNFTPRQWRRWRHKYGRAHSAYFGHWGDDGKGRPTPRQRKRRAEP